LIFHSGSENEIKLTFLFPPELPADFSPQKYRLTRQFFGHNEKVFFLVLLSVLEKVNRRKREEFF